MVRKFVIFSLNPGNIAFWADKKGIQVIIHYPIPLSRQKAFAFLNYKKGDFPMSEKQANAIISLPIYPELTKSDVVMIVTHIKTFYAKN